MGLKKQELIDGCFAKAADDEPIFVLRATDKFAPAIVREWARQFATGQFFSLKASDYWMVKYREAIDLADAMETWPNRKMPD